MHAEVTNTRNPDAALTPCRMCTLKVKKLKYKHTRTYLRDFLHRDESGNVCPQAACCWATTKAKTHQLFKITNVKSYNQFLIKAKKFGLKDSINTEFLNQAKTNRAIRLIIKDLADFSPNRLFNPFLQLKGFDGVLDTPVEILHVVLLGVVKYLARDLINGIHEKEKWKAIGRLESFSCTSLNIDSLKPKYLVQHVKSLIGRDFKILLQAAPFALIEFMDPEQKKVWLSLCRLTPLIFQTKIKDMEECLSALQSHIDDFLYHLIGSTAQWINKPKIHMLLHLVESIRRFGPASLVSTEKFESFNGVLRKGSVHSNRQAPGRDLATSFDSYGNIRFVVLGGVVYDKVTGSVREIGHIVTSFFNNNEVIRKSLGYSSAASHPLEASAFPFKTPASLGEEDKTSIPVGLRDGNESANIGQIPQLQMNKHDKLQKGVFVAVANRGIFARVFTFGNHNPSLCPLKKTKALRMEHQQTAAKTWQVEHTDTRHFLINSASLHDVDLHRTISDVSVPILTADDWLDAMTRGLEVWNDFGDNWSSDGLVTSGDEVYGGDVMGRLAAVDLSASTARRIPSESQGQTIPIPGEQGDNAPGEAAVGTGAGPVEDGLHSDDAEGSTDNGLHSEDADGSTDRGSLPSESSAIDSSEAEDSDGGSD
ncbi:hypothetical protein MJO28_013644 [Puccinia striiformis f. sp. tritici]|uniref:Uncharacterized protein n=1 Tax=Puccinia striiformis f. sp. tritici TaxID=168172 RepID=A0ACC0DV25_9BASI|nr:hypothetical protein MJO28_013644 [Puccinia striiformis f. sp. tritici]